MDQSPKHRRLDDSYIQFAASAGPLTEEEKEYRIRKGVQRGHDSMGEGYTETISFHLTGEEHQLVEEAQDIPQEAEPARSSPSATSFSIADMVEKATIINAVAAINSNGVGNLAPVQEIDEDDHTGMEKLLALAPDEPGDGNLSNINIVPLSPPKPIEEDGAEKDVPVEQDKNMSQINSSIQIREMDLNFQTKTPRNTGKSTRFSGIPLSANKSYTPHGGGNSSLFVNVTSLQDFNSIIGSEMGDTTATSSVRYLFPTTPGNEAEEVEADVPVEQDKNLSQINSSIQIREMDLNFQTKTPKNTGKSTRFSGIPLSANKSYTPHGGANSSLFVNVTSLQDFNSTIGSEMGDTTATSSVRYLFPTTPGNEAEEGEAEGDPFEESKMSEFGSLCEAMGSVGINTPFSKKTAEVASSGSSVKPCLCDVTAKDDSFAGFRTLLGSPPRPPSSFSLVVNLSSASSLPTEFETIETAKEPRVEESPIPDNVSDHSEELESEKEDVQQFEDSMEIDFVPATQEPYQNTLETSTNLPGNSSVSCTPLLNKASNLIHLNSSELKYVSAYLEKCLLPSALPSLTRSMKLDNLDSLNTNNVSATSNPDASAVDESDEEENIFMATPASTRLTLAQTASPKSPVIPQSNNAEAEESEEAFCTMKSESPVAQNVNADESSGESNHEAEGVRIEAESPVEKHFGRKDTSLDFHPDIQDECFPPDEDEDMVEVSPQRNASFKNEMSPKVSVDFHENDIDLDESQESACSSSSNSSEATNGTPTKENEEKDDSFSPKERDTFYVTCSSEADLDLDDTITNMERLLALAEVAELAEHEAGAAALNYDLEPFPENLPCSFIEDVLAERGQGEELQQRNEELEKQNSDNELEELVLSPANGRVAKKMVFKKIIMNELVLSPAGSARISPGSSSVKNTPNKTPRNLTPKIGTNTPNKSPRNIAPNSPLAPTGTPNKSPRNFVPKSPLAETNTPIKCPRNLASKSPIAETNTPNKSPRNLPTKSPNLASKSPQAGPSNVAYGNPTVFKTPAVPSKTPSKYKRTDEPMEINSPAHQVKGHPSITPKLPKGPCATFKNFSTSTPVFRKVAPPSPLAMSSPASTIGYPTPPPLPPKTRIGQAGAGLPTGAPQLQRIPTRLSKPSISPFLLSRKSPAMPSPRILTLISPVADYIYNSPPVQLQQHQRGGRGGGQSDRIVQSLPRKVRRVEDDKGLKGSGIPIRKMSLPVKAQGQGGTVENRGNSPSRKMAIPVSGIPSGKGAQATTDSPALINFDSPDAAAQALTDCESPALMEFESPTSCAASGSAQAQEVVEQDDGISIPVGLPSDTEELQNLMELSMTKIRQSENKALKEVKYFGSEKLRDGKERTVEAPIIPFTQSNPIIILGHYNKENLLAQRHTGQMSESFGTSIIRSEPVIKSSIPSRIATMIQKK